MDSQGKIVASLNRAGKGNVDAALASAAHTVSGTFSHHYQGHMPIGPNCAVADVGATSATLWSNTQNVENCVTSRALSEEVTFNKNQVTSIDWIGYPILRFKDSPKVTNVLVQRTDQPSLGSGEPVTCPLTGAIANAFFDATGVRMTRVPDDAGTGEGDVEGGRRQLSDLSCSRCGQGPGFPGLWLSGQVRLSAAL
jgi:CO/xanthine dehydrogenase Mo-binding subunit